MRVILAIGLMMLTVAPATFLAQRTGDAGVALKAAQHKEQVEGDLKGAMEAYKRLASAAEANRSIAAQALMGLARCHQKLGDADARAIYERITREFSDQPAIVAEARAQLNSLGATLGRGGLAATQILRLPSSVATLVAWPDGRFSATDWSTGNLVSINPSSGAVQPFVVMDSPNSWGEDSVLSPDLRQVVYLWFDGTEKGWIEELRLMELSAGAKPRALLSGSARMTNLMPVAWSKDGRAILVQFEQPAAPETGRQSGLGDFRLAWVSSADGAISVFKELEWWRGGGQNANNFLGRVSLSPDGRHVAYSAATLTGGADRSVFVVRADGTAEWEVARGSINEEPIWTPDGRRLIFLSNRSGSYGLWTVPFRENATELPTVLKDGVGRVQLLGITGNGRLSYSEHGGVNTLSIADIDVNIAKSVNQPPRVNEALIGLNPAWSYDGKYLAYRRPTRHTPGNYELVVRTMSTGEERTYSMRVGTMTANAPEWHPDGTLQSAGNTDVRLKVDGLHLEEIRGPLPLPLGEPAPDGKTLFLRGRPAQPAVAFDVTSGARRELSLPAGWLAVSPDGRSLALGTQLMSGEPSYIGLAAIDGSGLKKLYTLARGPAREPIWTPDGRGILVAESHGDGTASIVRVSVDGAPPVIVAANIPRLQSFDLSPDGRRLAYSTDDRTTEIWTLELSSLLNNGK